MLKIKLQFLLLIIMVLTACNRLTVDSYVGYWQQNDSKYHAYVAEIKKEGEQYTFMSDVLSDKDDLGKPIVPTILTVDGKNLLLPIANHTENLLLTENADQLQLTVGNKTYTKIDETSMQKLKQERKICQNLRDGYANEIKGLNLFNQKDQQKRANIQANYLPKFEALSHCDTPFMTKN